MWCDPRAGENRCAGGREVGRGPCGWCANRDHHTVPRPRPESPHPVVDPPATGPAGSRGGPLPAFPYPGRQEMAHERHLGLFGATALGVGAIVGGGILALAGVAFATTGPSAIVAFGLNGAIAFLTADEFRTAGPVLHRFGRPVSLRQEAGGVVPSRKGGVGRRCRSGEGVLPPPMHHSAAGAITPFSRERAVPASSWRGRRRSGSARSALQAGHRTLEAAGIGAAAGDAVNGGPGSRRDGDRDRPGGGSGRDARAPHAAAFPPPTLLRPRAWKSRRTPAYRKSRLPTAAGSRSSSGRQIESATM